MRFVVAMVLTAATGSMAFAGDYETLKEPADDVARTEKALLTQVKAMGGLDTKAELASFYINIGEWKKAGKIIEPVLREAPADQRFQRLRTDMAQVRFSQASAFGKLGAGKAMRKGCEADLALDQDDVDALFCVARYYAMAPGIAGGDMQKAQEIVERLKDLDLATHYRLVAELEGGEDWDLALDALRRGVALGGDAELLRQAFIMFAVRREWPDATAAAQKLREEFPDDQLGLFYTGMLAVDGDGDLDQGEDALLAFLTKPTFFKGTDYRSGAHRRLAEIYRRRGQTDLALKAAKRALELNAKNDLAKAIIQQINDAG